MYNVCNYIKLSKTTKTVWSLKVFVPTYTIYLQIMYDKLRIVCQTQKVSIKAETYTKLCTTLIICNR